MKLNLDSGFNGDGTPILHIRPVTPLAHCLKARADELRRAAQRFEIVNLSIFTDHSVQENVALNVHLSSPKRVIRFDSVNHCALHNIAWDIHVRMVSGIVYLR
jgi:hypothetical protein